MAAEVSAVVAVLPGSIFICGGVVLPHPFRRCSREMAVGDGHKKSLTGGGQAQKTIDERKQSLGQQWRYGAGYGCQQVFKII